MDENKEDLMENEGDLIVYELGYHLLPNISEEEIKEEVSKIHTLLKKNDGAVISEGAPQLTELAYEMVKRVETRNFKFNKAFFGWVKFELDSSKIGEIKNKMESTQNILRFLIVKTVKENTMYTSKAPIFRKEVMREEVPEILVEKVPVSEAEIDKSIDELLVNEKLEIQK